MNNHQAPSQIGRNSLIYRDIEHRKLQRSKSAPSHVESMSYQTIATHRSVNGPCVPAIQVTGHASRFQ